MTVAATHAVIPAQAGTYDASIHFADVPAFAAVSSRAQSQPDVGARLRGHDVAADAIEPRA